MERSICDDLSKNRFASGGGVSLLGWAGLGAGDRQQNPRQVVDRNRPGCGDYAKGQGSGRGQGPPQSCRARLRRVYQSPVQNQKLSGHLRQGLCRCGGLCEGAPVRAGLVSYRAHLPPGKQPPGHHRYRRDYIYDGQRSGRAGDTRIRSRGRCSCHQRPPGLGCGGRHSGRPAEQHRCLRQVPQAGHTGQAQAMGDHDPGPAGRLASRSGGQGAVCRPRNRQRHPGYQRQLQNLAAGRQQFERGRPGANEHRRFLHQPRY